MIVFITGVIEKYFASYDNTDTGYSRKKLSGTFLIVSGVAIQFLYLLKSHDWSMAPTFATIDFSTGTVIMGINTYQNIKTNPTISETSKNETK